MSITSSIVSITYSEVLSKFNRYLSAKMTSLEIHLTTTSYENSYIYKISIFEFINSYFNLFFLLILKARTKNNQVFEYLYERLNGNRNRIEFTMDICGIEGCMEEAFIQLLLNLTKRIITNVWEISWPFIQRKVKTMIIDKNEFKKNKKPFTKCEKNYRLLDFSKLQLHDDYLEIVINYGYVVLFSVACPLAPLLCLINNIFEVRIDAIKFMTQFKRPMPEKANSIGSWFHVISITSKLATFFNGLIIAFSSDFLLPYAFRWYNFNNRKSEKSIVLYLLKSSMKSHS